MKGIGTKLALQIAIGLIGIMALVGVYMVSAQKEDELASLQAEEERSFHQISLILSNLLYELYNEQIERVIRSYLTDPGILSIQIQDEEQRVKYLGKDPESGEIVDFSGEDAVIPSYAASETRQQKLLYEDEVIGALEVVYSRQRIDERMQQAVIGLIQLIILIVVIESVLIVFLIKKNVSAPLSHLAQAALQIADGDIAVQLRNSSSTNEVGMLSSAFGKMIAYIREMADVATNISKGNLRQEVLPRSDTDVLGHAFQNMSVYLNEIAKIAEALADGDFRREIQTKGEQDLLGQTFQKLGDLRRTMSNITEGSTQLYEASEQLSQTSAQIAASMEQISQQTHVVSSTSRQISENANSVAAGIEEMSANIREISRNTQEVVKTTDTAVELTSSTTNTIIDLEARSKEIEEVIQVITSVTQQTNLLALNATIEAARAGDEGKGFAIVAKEIKNLSMETASSAENIIQNLEMIRDGSRHVSKASAKTMEFTTKIQELTNSTANGIEEQSVTANAVAERMGETAEKTKGITLAISDIAATTQHASEGINTIQQASVELAELAGRLQKLITHFKI